MATAAAFERQTKVVPYVWQKSQTVDNVLPPQRRWHAVEIFQTVIVQEEKPATLSDFFDFHPVVSPTIVPATLKKIKRPSLIARSFEPHARKEILELLAARISELRQTLGQPGVATAVARLRADLKKGYEAASLRDDMANFASAISLLQDYCYMHWSKMSADQLTRIENTLIPMRKKSEISPKDITRIAAALREQGRSLDYPSTVQLYLDDPSFADACTFSTETFSNRDLKTLLGLTISLMQEQGFDPANPANKETCRRKLQDHIFSVAEELFSLYRNVGIAEEACSKLRKHLVRKELEERDDHMLEFSEAFKNDKICRSLCSVDALLKANQYRSSYQCVIDKGLAAGSTPTTKKLAAALKERIDSPDDTTCTRCSKIGDVIIAVNCPHNFQIHTLDTSFSTVAPCFSREVQIHPSTKALLKM